MGMGKPPELRWPTATLILLVMHTNGGNWQVATRQFIHNTWQVVEKVGKLADLRPKCWRNIVSIWGRVWRYTGARL